MQNYLVQIYKIAADKRNQTLMFFIFLALGVTYLTVNQIEFNYQLDQKASQLSAEVDVLEQQNKNQRLRNQFLQSDYYQELLARDQLGLVAEGEKVVVFSDTLIDRRQTLLGLNDAPPVVTEELAPSKFEQWLRFFRGRPPL